MVSISKILYIFVAIVLLDQPFEILPREEIHKLREHISTLIHNYLDFRDAYNL